MNDTIEKLKKENERLKKENERLKKNEIASDKRIDALEKKNKELQETFENKEKEWFEIEKNPDKYSNFKVIKELELREKSYKELYDFQLKINKENMEEFRKKLEKKDKLHNERGAGRKLFIDEEKIIKIISENKEKSLRDIEKIFAEQGEKISIMTIRKYKKSL